MNAVEIISHCRNSGIALAVDAEGKLHVRGDKDGITTLREDIKVHKAELVAILQPPLTLDLTREDHRQEALAAVERGESVLVVSATLGESVYWVPDEEAAERIKQAPDYRGEVIYTLLELQELTGKNPEFLRGIHRVKKFLGATLVPRTSEGTGRSELEPVRCGNCQHFQRIDHPHMGQCTQGHGRYYLWEIDRRLCKDFLSQAEGDGEQGKAGVFEELLAELEWHSEAKRQALKIAREALERLGEMKMQVRELEASLVIEKAYNRLWALRTHNPASGLSEPDIRLLLQLCHPDKHNGSEGSKKATQLLLGMRRAQ